MLHQKLRNVCKSRRILSVANLRHDHAMRVAMAMAASTRGALAVRVGAPHAGFRTVRLLGRLPARRLRALSDDSKSPYEVLGVPADSDSETIRKTYKRRLAETRDDPRARQAIEDAHSRLVMAALSSRLSGKMKVDRAVRYADRAAILPWRPRLCRADGPTILLSSLIQAGMLVWALSAPSEATTQPVVWSLAFGGIGNVVKQNKLFPPPAQSDYEAAGQGQGMKNLLRGAFLAVLATLAGVLVAWTLPDLAASLLDADLPDWFYGAQFVLLAFGATLSNGLMTAFFR